MRRVSKLEAARRQIDAAIRMLFNEDDVLAVHTLAWAGYSVVRDVAKATGKEGLLSKFFEEHVGPYYRTLANFLKHADRAPNAETFLLPNEMPALLLEVASSIFVNLGENQTVEMRALNQILDVKYRRLADHDDRREMERDDARRDEIEHEEELRLEGLIEEHESEPEEAEMYRAELAEILRWRHQREKIRHSLYMEMGRKLLGANRSGHVP